LLANALIDSNFNISTKTNKDLLKEDKDIIIETKVKQAYYLNKLYDINSNKLKELKLIDLYHLEINIALILSKMEISGILVDKNELSNLQNDFNKRCHDLETKIKQYANEDININSIKQLGELLFNKLNLRVIKKTKTGYSTDIDVLNELVDDHPIIPLLIEYRSVKKILSTYIEPMFNYILSDNRIHTIYNQCLTQTGRLSSKDPNLQNIATKSEDQRVVKKMFISKPNYSLVSFDYSQIELRILASFSLDPVFIKAFEEGYDIHTDTASKVNGIPYDAVTASQRKAAKAINFGIIYGMSDFGLAKSLGIDRNYAHDFIKKYYETYPNIKSFLDKQVQDVMDTGYSKTILNRIRYINEINSNNHNIRESGKRMALNTPIQGSAADILKIAMINIDKYITSNNLDAKMLLQVHDELIFEVNDKIIDSFNNNIIKIMDEAYQLAVKLEVHCSYGKNWYDL
ncbi:MAG: DNA polymerase I, partial [Bacilli bacterium]|nr:DNA polymerase I [Bacilli bacterium]